MALRLSGLYLRHFRQRNSWPNFVSIVDRETTSLIIAQSEIGEKCMMDNYCYEPTKLHVCVSARNRKLEFVPINMSI